MNPITRLVDLIKSAGIEYALGVYPYKYRGIVVNRDDPQRLARLRIAVPGVYEDAPDYWVPSSASFAENGAGLIAIPRVGEAVFVTFENGDPRFPVWEHGWYGENDTIQVQDYPDNYVFRSPAGRMLELNDKTGYVRLTDASGRVVEINESNISLGSQNQSAEPAVLGDTLEELLTDLIDLIEGARISGSRFSFSTRLRLTLFKLRVSAIKSKRVTLD